MQASFCIAKEGGLGDGILYCLILGRCTSPWWWDKSGAAHHNGVPVYFNMEDCLVKRGRTYKACMAGREQLRIP